MAPAVEVAPVSLTADGMVPSFIPFIISSGVYPPYARCLCLCLEFSHGLLLLLMRTDSVRLHFHPFVSRWQDDSLNLTFRFEIGGGGVVVSASSTGTDSGVQ